jgi:hypothetical protein
MRDLTNTLFTVCDKEGKELYEGSLYLAGLLHVLMPETRLRKVWVGGDDEYLELVRESQRYLSLDEKIEVELASDPYWYLADEEVKKVYTEKFFADLEGRYDTILDGIYPQRLKVDDPCEDLLA